jgi:predicted ATPase
LCISHRALGTTYVTMGEFEAGRRHLERARLLYDSDRHAQVRYLYGQDIGATALCYLCWALWHLGHFEEADTVAAEAVAHAEAVGHPHTFAYTICHSRGMMDVFRRDAQHTRDYTTKVVAFCTEHGFPFWAAGGRILGGWAEVAQGRAEKGIELLQAGLADWQATGARLWLPLFYALEAEALSKLDRHDAALARINKAMEVLEETGERWALAEVLRLKSVLLRHSGRGTIGDSERLLSESLKIARSQQARSWELRTSCDLALLWHEQGREHEAVSLLRDICQHWPVGSSNLDVQRANSLLAELQAGAVVGQVGMVAGR